MIRAHIFIGVLLVAVTISRAQYQSIIRQGVLGSNLVHANKYEIPEGFCDSTKLIHLGCSHKVSVEVTVEDVVPYPAIDFSSDLNAVVIKRKPGVFGCSGPALVQVRYTCARNHWKKPQWKPWPSWKPANNYRVPENSWKASKGRAEELSDVVVPEDVGMLENIKTISDERKPIYFSDPWVRHDDGMQEGDYLPRYLREIRIQKNAKEPKPRDPKKADIVALHKAPLHL